MSAPADANPPGKGIHVFDDIVEEDNHLPNWWLATLFAVTGIIRARTLPTSWPKTPLPRCSGATPA